MTKEEQKIYQLRMPKDLHEKFYRAFPGRGERKLLLERFIELVVERSKGKDAFIEGVLDEAKEIYTDLEEE